MRKRLFAIAIMFFIPILSSCSSKQPEPIKETIYEKQYIPLNLMILSCKELPAGETVRSLGASQVNNTSCLRAHQKLVEGLIRNHTREGIMSNEQSIRK